MAAVYKNFIYMEGKGFIFAYVPKVACTNWKSLMRYMVGKEDWLDNRLAHDKMNGGLRYLDLKNEADLSLLSDKNLRKFAMVRDPFSRALSGYLNKVEKHLPIGPESEGEDHFCKVTRNIDEFRQAHLDVARYPCVNFEVFLLWLRDSKSWFTKDEHWAPQVTLLRQPEVRFDFIGRFENLAEDAPKMLEAMGCDQGFPTQKDVKFAPTKATEKMQRYMTGISTDLILELFDSDFESFEYQKVSY